MTRKDYEMIAATIRETLDKSIPGREAYRQQSYYAYQLANDFADKLEADNSRFDRTKFIQACGFQE